MMMGLHSLARYAGRPLYTSVAVGVELMLSGAGPRQGGPPLVRDDWRGRASSSRRDVVVPPWWAGVRERVAVEAAISGRPRDK